MNLAAFTPRDVSAVYNEHAQVRTRLEDLAEIKTGEEFPRVEAKCKGTVLASLCVEELVEATHPRGLDGDVLQC